jgi:hypothetical protein
MASRNVATSLRDEAWLYAKGYDIDAPVETMVNFIVHVDRLELSGVPQLRRRGKPRTR